MHANLYRGLGVTPSDLSRYENLLVGFDGKAVILARYQAPCGRRWKRGANGFHSSACLLPLYCNSSSTLAPCHGCATLFPTFESEVPHGTRSRGDQGVARQCCITAIAQKSQIQEDIVGLSMQL